MVPFTEVGREHGSGKFGKQVRRTHVSLVLDPGNCGTPGISWADSCC